MWAMRRSSNQSAYSQPSVFASLLAPVLVVAAVGLLGWLLLVTIKWLVVTLLVALGVALIIVPFAAGGRIIGTTVGAARVQRIGQLATAVLLGIAFIVLAVVVSHHGWLLVVVPVLVVLIGRLMGRFSAGVAARRERSFR